MPEGSRQTSKKQTADPFPAATYAGFAAAAPSRAPHAAAPPRGQARTYARDELRRRAPRRRRAPIAIGAVLAATFALGAGLGLGLLHGPTASWEWPLPLRGDPQPAHAAAGLQ